jgi:Reverse transcriptase (RNA-dependent DNA polymerase)
MQEINQQYTDLFSPPPHVETNNIPVHYIPAPIQDDVPTEMEIATTIEQLRKNKAPGPSGIPTEDTKRWSKQEDKTDWNRLVRTIQHIFETGTVPQRLCFSNLILIPKSDGGIRGIGLLETIWKIISIIIKNSISHTVIFDQSLHGFRRRRSTSTAIIDAKLQLDMNNIKGIMYYQIFLDVSKAYGRINRQQLLTSLSAYGMGPNELGLLRYFWQQLWLAPKQSGYYGKPIKSDR